MCYHSTSHVSYDEHMRVMTSHGRHSVRGSVISDCFVDSDNLGIRLSEQCYTVGAGNIILATRRGIRLIARVVLFYVLFSIEPEIVVHGCETKQRVCYSIHDPLSQ